MKYIVVFALTFVVVSGIPPEVEKMIREKMEQLGEECKAEIGATDDEIAPIKAHELPTTQNAKCFLACMHKKFGIQDADGKIDKDATYALVEKMKTLDTDLYEKMKQVTDKCSEEVKEGADECETAINIYVCTQREKKAIGIKPIDETS